MDSIKKLFADKIYLGGFVFLLISFAIFLFPKLSASESDAFFGVFFLNYLIAVVYFFVLVATRKRRSRAGSLPHIFLFLLMFLVSAYSLNTSMAVFQISVPWVCVAIMTYSITFILASGYWDSLGTGIKYLLSLILGSSVLFFLYLTVYCSPLMPMSLIISFVLGFSLHTFVPLLFVIYIIRLCYEILLQHKQYRVAMVAGFMLSLLVAGAFAIRWNTLNNIAGKNFQKSLIADNTDLPSWVKVARDLPDSWVLERFLKGGLVYTQGDDLLNDGLFSMPERNINEVRKHDPLVVFAGMFNEPPQVSEDDKINILETVYDARHNTQQRLWQGQNLQTAGVISNVRIWPKLRMAYTEKTVTVSNNNPRHDRWNREEAIYTFHLPEGAVVSSSSLWVKGKEQKAVLTSLKKADSAYHQIVGVEQHDPSVIHWQEGNTVTVRVFPVTGHESRVFKMGITSPLQKEGDKLVYETAWFEGPDATNTPETIQVAMVDEDKDFKMPDGFSLNADHRYIRDAKYDPFFKLTMNCPELDTKSTFSFDGSNYAVKTYVKERRSMQLESVYLDVNKAWTWDEYNEVCNLFKNCKVYVYADNLFRISDNNKSALFKSLREQRFSIFPLFEISNPETSLIISKSTEHGPNIKALNETDFLKKLSSRLAKGGTYRLYNLGNQLSPYLKTLKEHRTFEFEEGDMAQLKKLVADKQFARNIEDDDHLVIDNAGIELVRSNDTTASTGPDHLMRLFTYNHIMQELKSKLSGDYSNDTTLVAEAEKAYVVSPVSSLIALETKEDYDRFKINKSSNTLDDATLKARGAVPEPHEWALIIIAVLMGTWLLFKERVKQMYNLWSK